MIVDDATPITALPPKARTKEDREKEWSDAISSMNSEKSKNLLASLLKK